LVEGGTRAWTLQKAARFRKLGGERILFVCSQASCRHLVKRLASISEGEGTQARAEYLGNLGHHLGPQVTRQLKEPWQWLVEGSGGSAED
jgi:hypothetical protein